MIRQSWWKILGVLLLMYTFIAGLMMPLKPGIIQVTPGSLQAGEEVALTIRGYNSSYAKTGKEKMRAWLKMDEENILAASKVEVLSNRDLKVSFNLPAYLPSKDSSGSFALILDHPSDGSSVLPNAVFITQDSIDPSKVGAAWKNGGFADLNEHPGKTIPFRNILKESIRNQYFHVPLWFAMMFLFLFSLIHSIKYLRKGDPDADLRVFSLNQAGMIYGLLGVVTGALWAKHTWGAYWSWDTKQNMTAICLLIYAAYFVLRGAFQDDERKARLSAIYNIFAFAAMIPLLFVIPRMTDSLHPGAGGNPAFGGDDLDNTMRMVFYPAGVGWTLLGFWVASIVYRIRALEFKWLDR
jgi:heme exporter protein C